MKKLLSILAAVGLSATASTAVVACGSSSKSIDDKYPYSGQANPVEKTIDLKDGRFQLEMILPKGLEISDTPDDDGLLGIGGQKISSNDSGETYNELVPVKTENAVEGKAITDADNLEWDFGVKESDVKGKTKHITVKDDDDEIGLLVLNESIKVTVTISSTNGDIKQGDKLSIVLAEDYEDAKDKKKSYVKVKTDLFNLTFNVKA